MILVGFKDTFRDRAPEWAMSAALLAWGMIVIFSANLFQAQDFYHPLLEIGSQLLWGVITSVIGGVRLIFLIVNGVFRPSAHIRALGCVVGCVVWGSLLTASLSLTWAAPSSAIYASMLALDFISLWFAAGDAKLADMSARNRI